MTCKIRNSFLIFVVFIFVSSSFAKDFSFLVMGDTRTEVYVTGGVEQTPQIMKILSKRYTKAKEIKLKFDKYGTQIQTIKIKYPSHKKIMLYKDGWLKTYIYQKKDKNKVVMRDIGRKWVNKEIISTMRNNEASFIIHGGDIPLFGLQGKGISENPYYQLFNQELLMHLPDREKFFPALGNHEVWGDEEKILGFTSTFPWLKKYGFSAKNRVYDFVQNNCSFIFLDAGGYAKKGTAWVSKYPEFKVQMNYLKDKLEDAKKNKRDFVFVVYHKPSFNQVGHDPLPKEQNPHIVLKKYAKDLKIYVFNSHVHTTEHYVVDGINYQVIGGSGAPQKTKIGDNPSKQKELYWNGKKRFEEYNYLKVDIKDGKIKGTIHRFRPLNTLKPFSTAKIF